MRPGRFRIDNMCILSFLVAWVVLGLIWLSITEIDTAVDILACLPCIVALILIALVLTLTHGNAEQFDYDEPDS